MESCRDNVFRENLRTKHQKGDEWRTECGVISGYIPAVHAAGTTTNVSRYFRGIELQFTRSRRGAFAGGHAKYARSFFDNLIPMR